MDENERILERIGPILAELDERLGDEELSERTLTALHAAIGKAAVAGFQVGAGHVAWVCHLHGVNVDMGYLGDVGFDMFTDLPA